MNTPVDVEYLPTPTKYRHCNLIARHREYEREKCISEQEQTTLETKT